ncbi:class A beta-lactamase-related serine hydrolase [Enterococcus devriesei]|uniref:serine hydrolase n=1 Tax=Enterococcus devriesei TaxID=319970 RepID=UPI00288FEFCB|nr:serine hydrolase [Enterococcus devriesei]MDT2822163.1 class A beta-lactamase-related serine hydrolase [Enterococcus devriesei]
MGRHTDPNEKSKGKYVAIGLLAVALSGALFFGVRTVLNYDSEKQEVVQPEKKAKAKTAASSTKPSEKTVATKKTSEAKATKETSKATKNSSKKSSKKKTATTKSTKKESQTKESSTTKQAALPKLDSAKLTASAGKVYYGVHYFKSGRDYSSKNSEATVAANVIKVFIMDYALAQKNDEQIDGKNLREWLEPMIQKNDDDATNVLIDHYGIDQMNAYFKEQGYQDTKIERRMLDINVKSDKDNYTSLNDCLKLLEKLYDQKEQEPQKTMIAIMEGQKIRTKIPHKLPKDLKVANITGEQDQVENDIGIVFAKDDPYAIVVLTKEVPDIVKTREAIAEYSLAASKLK